MSIPIGTKMLTKPPKQKSKTPLNSPVKFAHSLLKKSRTVSSWELCIICQISCDHTLSKASEKGKCTLFKAVGLWKDDVHRRLPERIRYSLIGNK
jgi:hypothetical protein